MAARVHRRLDLHQRARHRCDEEEDAQKATSRCASDGDLIHGCTSIFECLATSGIAAEVPGFSCHRPGDDADRSYALALNVYRYALGKGRAAGPPFRHDRRQKAREFTPALASLAVAAIGRDQLGAVTSQRQTRGVYDGADAAA
jgi:hypothetical protein